MSVVNFPGNGNNDEYIITGNFDFTCSNCNNTNSFRGQGMIFKTIEFYCSSCGKKHVVSNPNIKK